MQRSSGNTDILTGSRNDKEAKFRGLRIELEEIEAQLARHPLVKEAVVLSREDLSGEKRLVAYLVPKDVADANGQWNSEALRAHLRSLLPDHMVPSALILLPSLPLTPNGQLDRHALPIPEHGTSTREYEPPQGEIEELLAEIWRSLLRVERVGRGDNFFELGGHSLLSAEISQRVGVAGLFVQDHAVFKRPRLKDLASVISRESPPRAEVSANLIPAYCNVIEPSMLPLVDLSTEHIQRIVETVPGGAANIQDVYPLAPLQEGPFFNHLHHPKRVHSYLRSTLLSLPSRQKVDQLIEALQSLIDRHDILRTGFLWDRLPRPVQVVYRKATVPVEMITPGSSGDTLERLKERMKRGPQQLDLRYAPLMRLQIAVDERGMQWYALLQTHQLICDSQSLEILFAETVAHLEQREEERREQLPYRNHVVQALAQNAALDASAFFRAKLGDVDEPTAPFGLLDVHGDYSRVARAYRALDTDLGKKIRAQARRLRVSAPTVFHAAWALVVASTSGCEDVVFGSVLGGLQRSVGAQQMLGMLINTLPLRLRLRDLTSKELIEQTHRELTELLGHAQSSPVVAQRFSGVSTSLPLFSAVLNYRHDRPHHDARWLSERAGVRVLASRDYANYGLVLSVDEQGESFGLEAETEPRIDPHRILGYMSAALEALIRALEQQAHRPALSLSVLPEYEHRQVIQLFNASNAARTPEKFIHEIFEEQTERTPNAVAVTYRSESLTYAELNSRANQLARYLQDKGVCPDQRVGICVERSLDMVIGLVGILKSSGAYVPLDPAYPPERIAYMLDDAAPKVLLSQARLRGRLPQTAAEIVLVDEDWELIARQETRNLESKLPGLHCGHLAYTIYTSGSTGRPKGVMVEHRNVTRLFSSTAEWFQFSERDVWTLFHSFAFDFSVWELWGALLYGGRVVVVPHLAARSPHDFYRLLCEEGVTILNQTPSAFAQLIDAQAESGQPGHSLRAVIFGGEALELSILRTWVERNGAQNPKLINMYGITETTVHVTYRELTETEIASDSGSLIGRALPDLRTYVLERRGEPVPIGVVGEIYVGGAGVARGYLNRPELTAERFIQDPFSADPRARMYKTGDLGRWRSDGTLEYLGRNDCQVKIRGFRIELGEIEAQLRKHPDVKEAVVTARIDERKAKSLVGYVVPDLARLKARSQGDAGGSSAEIVDQWKAVFEETYSEGTIGPTFVGWNSSYTGKAILDVEMREWLQVTVERIRALNPSRVLEIGCGVGLLVEQLAPHCKVYRGTDISAVAIDRLRSWTSRRPELRHVELEQSSALERDALHDESYDTVIVNSVVQLFPDADYLRGVLKRAVSWTSPGGRIFVGDVRPLSLLEVFQSSVQLSRASPMTTVRQLKSLIAHAIEREKDLLIDPEFFLDMPQELPGIGGAAVLLRRGHAENELTRYRYDVVLEVGSGSTFFEQERIDWRAGKNSDEQLAEIVALRPVSVRICGVPNRRLYRDVAAARLIKTSDESTTVDALRQILDSLKMEGEEPEYFWRHGESHGYVVRIGWHPGCSEGKFDVEWTSPCVTQDASGSRSAMENKRQTQGPLHGRRRAYTNDPSGKSLQRQLIPRLREFLKERLPAYMMPSIIMALDELPLTVNGKVDRRALPEPAGQAYPRPRYEAPQGEIEAILVEIWQDVLRVEQIGRQDNFFELGGHSLLIVQMIERLRRAGLSPDVQSVFDSPTLAALAAALRRVEAPSFTEPPVLIPPECESITPEMLSLIELKPEHVEWIVRAIPGGAKNVEDIYPLVPLQEGILFHHAFNQKGDTYIATTLFELQSQAELVGFKGALQRVVDRHPALRTAVLWDQLPRSVQVVCRRATLPVEEVKMDQSADPIAQLKEWMRPECQKLDVRRAPLMKLTVAADPCGPKCYALLHLHHLVSDRVSFEIMMSEVMAYLRGCTEELPEPSGYRNYVARTLTHGKQEEAEVYFHSRLGKIEQPTAPFDLVDVHGDGSQVEEVRQRIDEMLAWRVRSEARRLKVSVATLFHAAWALVISQTSGRSEVVFGTVLSGRMEGGLGAQRAIGMFINTLPLRLKLEELTIGELVWQTQLELTELMKFEQVSLTTAQRCSGVSGSAPLFSSLLTYTQNEPIGDDGSASGGSKVRVLARRWRTNYPIAVLVDDSGGEFVMTAQTDRRIDPRRMIGYLRFGLQSLVEAVAKAPEAPALSLSVLPDKERRQVIKLCSATEAPVRHEKMIYELFEDQAERTPDRVAVVYKEKSLTYAELNGRANQLARHLRDYGVDADRPVAICVERGPEMLVGLLGIWKAGGAYVPLDPDYPEDRLQYMVGDTAPIVLLTQKSLREMLPRTGAALVVLDDGWTEIARHSSCNLRFRAVHPNNLAYVIYTSGSTGQPKGVMVEHRSVVSHWHAIEKLYRDPINCQRIGANAHFTFDASIQQFVQLLSGRTLFLIPQSLRLDAELLLDFIEQHRIEGIDCTPSQLKYWISAGLLDRNGLCLRSVLVGGEAIDIALWNRLAQSETVVFHNVYGPTECTVDATSACIRDCSGVPCIGRPLANTETYLFDIFGRIVPIGVAGEVYIGGAGVARGYLSRPAMTAERFLANPFGSSLSERLYKTGDLGRWRTDGTIEYLGRNDDQVKLRGHRVELGEIEAQLLGLEQVKDAAVIVREDIPGEKHLVAYATERISTDQGGLSNAASLTAEVLRAYLKARLPSYMIPSTFVILNNLPLTSSGKLDRRALPALGADLGVSARYEAPQGESEELLASIWQKLLQVDRIGRWDDFFELGGHSILATRVVYHIRKEFGIAFPLEAVFSNPTIASVAEFLSRTPSGKESGGIPLKLSAADLKIVCFPPTSLGLGTQFRRIAECLGTDTAAYTCRLSGLLPDERPLGTMEEIAGHCMRQLDVAARDKECSLVGWSFSGFLAYELAVQMARSGFNIRRLVLIDTYVPALETLQRVYSDDGALREAFSRTIGVAGLDTRYKWDSVFQMFRMNLIALELYLREPPAYGGSMVEIRADASVRQRRYETDSGRGLPISAERVLVLPGDHYSIMDEGNSKRLGAAVEEALH